MREIRYKEDDKTGRVTFAAREFGGSGKWFRVPAVGFDPHGNRSVYCRRVEPHPEYLKTLSGTEVNADADGWTEYKPEVAVMEQLGLADTW
jgi:hypothetical protein